MAKELGLTRDQVLGRSRRLRIAGLADFLRAGELDPSRNEPNVRKTSRPAALIPEDDRMADLPLWDRVSPDRVGLKKAFIDIQKDECRWLAADGTYCAHAIHLRSFCPFHYAVAYRVDRAAPPVSQFECHAVGSGNV
jgi:hypothetical protein